MLVLRFIEHYFKKGCEGKNIAVLGMGEIGRKSAALLEETFKTNIIKINRTIAEKNENIWKPLESLPDVAYKIDVLVVATGSKSPVISFADIPVSKRQAPLLILDIGIPSQVDPGLEKAETIEYRNIDDLMKLNLDAVDQEAVEKLEQEIDKYVSQFRRFCIERDMVLLLDRTRKRHYEFTGTQIPNFIKSHLAEVDEPTRRKIEYELKGIFRDYTNDVFDSIHTALEDYWSKKQE
jgi:glutamyl-tRNA reductase